MCSACNFVEGFCTNKTIFVTYLNLLRYLALIGKHPDSSRNLDGKYDKQEEEELQKGEGKLNSADCVNVCACPACMC